MNETIHNTFELVYKILEFIGVLIMIVLGLLALLQVSNRFILSSYISMNLVWTEEIIRFLIIIMTMIGVPYALWTGEHISIRPLIRRLPEKYMKCLIVLSNILVIILSLIVVVSGYVVSQRTIDQPLITVRWIKVGYGHLMISILFGVNALFCAYITYCVLFAQGLKGNLGITRSFENE